MRCLKWAILVNLLLLTGCGVFSKKTGNEPMELVDFKPSAKLTRVWSRGVGAGQGEGFTRLTPSIDEEFIYTVDHKGQVFALNRLSGKKIWSKKIREAISGGISSEHGILLMGNTTGEVIALSNTDGQLLWRKQIQGEILSSPRTNGEIVAVLTMNGRIYALNAKTGEELWFYENPPPVLTLRGVPSPIVTDNAIYAGFSNGRLMAFNPENGSILWEQRIAVPQGRSELSRMVDIHATPLLQDGIIYVSTYQGKVAAVARGTGSGIWAQDSSSSESLAVDAGVLYISQAEGQLRALNAASGELLWENAQMLRRVLNGPQVVGDYVAVVDFKGYMHLLRKDTGEFAVRRRVDRKGVRAPMLSEGDILYVYGNSGKLIAFRAAER